MNCYRGYNVYKIPYDLFHKIRRPAFAPTVAKAMADKQATAGKAKIWYLK